jgi:signal peptidase I
MHHKRELKDNKITKLWKKFIHFLNEDDSFLSLLANIAIAFILIKFVVYPGLGLVLGTQFPIVAVVSGSMEHDGSFDDWWNSPAIYQSKMTTQSVFYEKMNITKEDFMEFRYKNGFNTGDIMLLRGKKAKNIEIGEVIVFQSDRPDPIIHRVIEKNIKDGKVFFKTKGDHNPTSYFFESEISEDEILGVAMLRVPYLGWVKIAFVRAILCVVQFDRCFGL